MSNIKDRIKNGVIVFEDILFRVVDEEIQVGDIYIAERNIGPQLLTAKEIIPVPTAENGLRFGGWVVPQEIGYCYDLHECVKVRIEID